MKQFRAKLHLLKVLPLVLVPGVFKGVDVGPVLEEIGLSLDCKGIRAMVMSIWNNSLYNVLTLTGTRSYIRLITK